MDTTIAVSVFSFIAGVIITGAMTIRTIDEAYEDGYKEGWLDAKERYIKKLRQISNQELVDNFVNSLREP